jgi:hypothetical protein
MSEETNQDAQPEAADSVRQAFAALPLGDKISTLLKVEWDLLGEVAEKIVNEASRAVDEIADAVIGPKPADSQESDSADQPAQ